MADALIALVLGATIASVAAVPLAGRLGLTFGAVLAPCGLGWLGALLIQPLVGRISHFEMEELTTPFMRLVIGALVMSIVAAVAFFALRRRRRTLQESTIMKRERLEWSLSILGLLCFVPPNLWFTHLSPPSAPVMAGSWMHVHLPAVPLAAVVTAALGCTFGSFPWYRTLALGLFAMAALLWCVGFALQPPSSTADYSALPLLWLPGLLWVAFNLPTLARTRSGDQGGARPAPPSRRRRP